MQIQWLLGLLVQSFTRTDFSGRNFRFFSTVCLELAATNSSNQRLCQFLNLDLKLIYSIRLFLNIDPTCRQRL